MKDKREYTELIDDYLDSKLEGEELEEFENLMSVDQSFYNEVKAQEAIRNTIQKLGDSELKEKFKKFHLKYSENEELPRANKAFSFKKSPFKKFWKKNSFAIAASFSILVMAGIFLYIQNRTIQDTTKKYTSYNSFSIKIITDTSGTMGYAGENLSIESIPVELIEEEHFTFHYRFRDTLQIFSLIPLENPDVELLFETKESSYFLVISGNKYQIIRGLNRILPLEIVDE